LQKLYQKSDNYLDCFVVIKKKQERKRKKERGKTKTNERENKRFKNIMREIEKNVCVCV